MGAGRDIFSAYLPATPLGTPRNGANHDPQAGVLHGHQAYGTAFGEEYGSADRVHLCCQVSPRGRIFSGGRVPSVLVCGRWGGAVLSLLFLGCLCMLSCIRGVGWVADSVAFRFFRHLRPFSTQPSTLYDGASVWMWAHGSLCVIPCESNFQ